MYSQAALKSPRGMGKVIGSIFHFPIKVIGSIFSLSHHISFSFSLHIVFMVSAVDRTKRALVTLLKSLALAYGVTLQITRESSDTQVRSAFRKVSRKTHPDRGGKEEDQKRLNDAHDLWQEALRQPRGNPGRRAHSTASDEGGIAPAPAVATASPGAATRGFVFWSVGVLLTYQKFRDASVWPRFVIFVKSFLVEQQVRNWCATMETNQDGTFHFHVMLQFYNDKKRNVRSFMFERVCPNPQPNDLLGEGWGGRRYQQSLDRAFFYVWADKEGTARTETGEICRDGDYSPAWTKEYKTYPVSGRWLDALLRAYKLSMDTYDEAFVHV